MFPSANVSFILLALVQPLVSRPMSGDENFPQPFTRKLGVQDPLLQGDDVTILQNLLLRSKYVTSVIATDGVYGEQTATAVKDFQRGNTLKSTGIFDTSTANLVLRQLLYDGYENQQGPLPTGYKFKIHIPVHKNRTIETMAVLMDANLKIRHTFIARSHGSINSAGQPRNQLTTNGNTPTGLITCDLNSPEPNHKAFGPYPVIRAVKGLKGNSAIGKNENNTFLSDYRDGILIHTGEWANWDPSKSMPNSNGCVHIHPKDMETIDDILKNELGVIVNENPFGKTPYPYKPQGLLSIDEVPLDS